MEATNTRTKQSRAFMLEALRFLKLDVWRRRCPLHSGSLPREGNPTPSPTPPTDPPANMLCKSPHTWFRLTPASLVAGAVVGITCGILAVLFLLQHFGTARVRYWY